MKKLNFLSALVLIFLVGCGSSSETEDAGGGSEKSAGGGSEDNTNGNTSGLTTGEITLSGDDTVVVGTILDTGYIGSSLAAESQPDYIVIVDKASTVTFTSPNILIPFTSNPTNGFVLVVTDDSEGSGVKGISMTIVVDGVHLNYVCTTPFGNIFTDCGATSISLDIANKTISFVDTTVINIDTDSILTINGSLVWVDDGGAGTGVGGNGNIGNTGAVTELEGTWGATCLYNDLWETYDTDSVTFAGNTFSFFGIEYTDSACTLVEDTYSSTGTFVIGDTLTASSGGEVIQIDSMFATVNGNNFTYTFYDIFRVDGDRLYTGDTGGFGEDEHDGSTLEARPIDLDFSFYLTKD